MNRFSEQFNKKAQSVQLNATERAALRSRIETYMEYHPLPVSMKEASGKLIPSPLMGEQYRAVRVPLAMLLKWSAGVSAVVLIIVPLLAEKAVPGDTLYAIKVRFNEELRSTLTLSPYEKVEWETERLNRRLAEARLLASEGRLTSDVEAEVAAAVRTHTESVQEEIEVLRESDADQATLASIELNTTLELQSSSLQGNEPTVMAMKAATETDEGSTQLIADVLTESLSKQESVVASSSAPAYDKIMARIESNTTRAYELLEMLNLPKEDRLYQGINRRLDDVKRSIEKANGLKSANNEEAARLHLLNALQRTQKLLVYLNDVEVGRGEMDLEMIIPTIPTPEEEQRMEKDYLNEIQEKVDQLNTQKETTSAAVREKIEATLVTVSEKQVAITATTEFGEKQMHATEALALLNDALGLVENKTSERPQITDPLVPLEPLPIASSTDALRRGIPR